MRNRGGQKDLMQQHFTSADSKELLTQNTITTENILQK